MIGRSYRIFTVGGIEVSIHWTWLLAFVFVTFSLGDYFLARFPSWGEGTAYGVAAVAAVLLFATVLVHELAHSFTARANGLPVRSISLFIFGGVSNLESEPAGPRVELLVAFAGPLASLLLAALFYGLYFVTPAAPSEVRAVLGYLALINVILAVFNLIPGFPLDGGRVLRSIVWAITGSVRRATQIASTIGNGIGFLFILGGLAEALLAGQIISGIWLAFIGWFLHNAATASYQQAIVDRLLLDVEVRDVMDPVLTTASADTPLDALIYRHLLGENQRTVPIVEGDGRLAGLVTLSDVRHIDRDDWRLVPVGRIMTPADRLSTVSPHDSLRDALRILAERDFHQLPVVENGRLLGMLNRAHVVQYLHARRQLEERSSSGER